MKKKRIVTCNHNLLNLPNGFFMLTRRLKLERFVLIKIIMTVSRFDAECFDYGLFRFPRLFEL